MNKCKILLIAPPAVPIEELQKETPTAKWVYPSVPLGILSIISYVEANVEVEFKVLDLCVEISNYFSDSNELSLNDFMRDQMAALYINEKPEIIGISALFNSNGGYLDPLSFEAKQLWPEALVVTGGGLPTNMPEYVFKNAPSIDAINIGEGENPFLKLIRSKNRQDYLDHANGWMTKDSEEIPPMDEVIVDLDEIPFLRYDLLNLKNYQGYHHQGTEGAKEALSAPIMTSRGCPYKCNFCSSYTVHGREIRRYSTARIMEDIRKLKKDFGVKNILIEDDLFLNKKSAALTILKEISKDHMTIEFTNGLSIIHIDEEMAVAIKQAGVEIASLAVESGCERVLNEIINKPYRKLSRVIDAVNVLRKNNIYIRAFFVIGFPQETMDELMETVQFMKDVGFNWCAIMIATPIAGSELYNYCKKNNLLLSDKEEDFHFGKCNMKLLHSTPEEFVKLRYLINLEVNFVENYDLKNGHYDLALNGFNDVLNRVPDHAFAHYFSSLCYEQINQKKQAEKSMATYFKIINESDEWKQSAIHFKLPV